MLTKYFCDLKVGDKIYHIGDKNEIDISEIKDIFVNEEFPEFKYIELILIPIIGDWHYIWLTKKEWESESLYFRDSFYTISAEEFIKVLNENV